MPRARKPSTRRADLIAAARHLIATKGFASTSVSDIVGAARVAQGTFYWYFSSKGEILDAVAEEIVSGTTQAIVAISTSPGLDAVEKFRQIKVVFLDYLSRGWEYIEHFHDERNSQLHHRLNQEASRRIVPVLTEIVRQGMSEGVFDTDYPEETAGFIYASTQAITECAMSQTESLEHRMEALWDFVFSGLGHKKGVTAPTSER
jgi:AcrR family transcriptional regulator